MATVNAVVYDQFKREDGTFHVQIKVFHKDVRRFIETNHYVTARQLDEDLKIKDKHILKSLDETLVDYRKTIGDLGPKLDFFTCDDLKAYLVNKDKEVDFIAFCTQHIISLRKVKRDGTANNHRAVRNSLIDYFKKKSVSIIEINSGMLFAYEKWLQNDRTMSRINQLGNEVTTTEKGMQVGGVYSHMRDLRTLFNEARKVYNNEDIGVVKIKHYPFKVYKIGAPPKTRKRNIPGEQLVKIKNCVVEPGGRAELARDLFLLSFYMCGMNAVDFYNLDGYDPQSTRLEYNRSKTSSLRDDGAFISIKIVPEARPLLEKYIGKLQDRYSTYNGLDTALSKGMKLLRNTTGIPEVTFYWARHTFATIARNKCKIAKEDIAEALNHVDGEHKTTDIYIEKDWSIVDNVQVSVMKFLRKLVKPKPDKPYKLKVKESVKELNNPNDQRKTMRLVSA
ncbi:Phage integrase SAM-like domain-containing protein [Mucilaginibacter mallensis]|uniref:Phage integrase SAM-like domain-containing protein n=1 Tax=Mucilaginibacter mallensis TaxID=652787 RepID=A0A1H2CEG2_MUCMA|nr:site-specific integrase [Mucilaginibacter mallensis]SDT68734.1 Phage integrase SAM-like domain-containing protein [Mucilaginibacter mallensis]